MVRDCGARRSPPALGRAGDGEPLAAGRARPLEDGQSSHCKAQGLVLIDETPVDLSQSLAKSAAEVILAPPGLGGGQLRSILNPAVGRLLIAPGPSVSNCRCFWFCLILLRFCVNQLQLPQQD